jgi:hypothetical protein
VEAEAVTFPYLIASAVLLLVKAIQIGRLAQAVLESRTLGYR